MRSRALLIVSCVLPLAVTAAVWYPVVRHYYVPSTRITESSVDDFLDRPAKPVLDRLGEQFLGRTGEPTSLPAESPEGRLRRAGLFDVAADLERFERTGDARLFEAITEAVIAFCRHANRPFAYDEFLWNDHAIANRVFVLAKFWGHYRRHPSFEAEPATQLLEQVAKGVRFLARDDHFTYWTNHGVMQSIALLHAANAFPDLPDRDRFVEVALERLTAQLEFFVSDSGWIMEHSAGYQEFGANLLATLLVELELLAREPPQDWLDKSRESKHILQWLLRPDGSIPNFGDSSSNANADDLVVDCERRSPGARHWPEGYVVAWDVGREGNEDICAQTVIVWSDFVSDAHKRPNELSVHYWVDGLDYVRSSGYWPYGDPDLDEATGWRGSNAPHYAHERAEAADAATESAICVTEDFRFVDLERRAKSHTVRRQVIDVGLAGLLVMDSGDTEAALESVWRIDTRLALVGPDGATLRAGVPFGGRMHVMQILGPSSAVHSLSDTYAREGHPSPTKFSAVAVDGWPVAAPAYVVTSRATEPTLIVLAERDASDASGLYRLSIFESPERWKIEGQDGFAVERSGSVVTLASAEGSPSRCNAARDVRGESIRRMESSFRDLADRYTIFKPWVEYRVRATLVILALLLGQLFSLAVLTRAMPRKLHAYLSGVSIAGWLGIGGYITMFYLAQ